LFFSVQKSKIAGFFEKMKTKSAIGILIFFVGISTAGAFSESLSIGRTTNVPSNQPVERFQEIQISISYSNNGAESLHDVVIEDHFRNIYGDVWGIPDNCTKTEEVLHCERGTLDIGASGEIQYSAQIAAGAPTGMKTIYSNIMAKNSENALLENSSVNRFRVTEASGQKYFSFDPTPVDGSYAESPEVIIEEKGETALQKMTNNVRPVLVADTPTEEEIAQDLEKAENSPLPAEEKSATKKQKISVTGGMGGDDSILDSPFVKTPQEEKWNQPNPATVSSATLSEENLHAAAPIKSEFASPDHLSSSGASAFFLLLISFAGTLFLRRKGFFQK